MISLPWYIGGPLIGLMVPVLLILREKQLGVSSSFRFVGSHLFPKWNYFQYNRLKDAWQLQFVVGIFLASIGLLSFNLVGEPELDPDASYTATATTIYSLENWLLFLVGGVAVGFGARYAGGCTAGHCIMGNALFALPSLVTTIAFFIGGLFVSHVILPQIF